MSIIRTTAARRGAAVAASVAVAALALSGCAAQSGSGGTGSAKAFDWSMTETTAAPSGDIDKITWAL